jgi:2-amino-4-hydroxy-6-hydroxymethyldihydropteridine diphosphokinase
VQITINGLSSSLSGSDFRRLFIKEAEGYRSQAAIFLEQHGSISVKAYLSLGSNLNDRAGNLLLGVRGMMNAGLSVSRLSSVYETDPVDVTDQPAFLNMAAELTGEPLPSPEQILARLLRIEYALGRRRNRPKGPRILDLDLLLYADEQRASEFLILPHPRLHLRRFVLVPLAELVPELIHPVLNLTIAQLLSKTPDASSVRRWQANEP